MPPYLDTPDTDTDARTHARLLHDLAEDSPLDVKRDARTHRWIAAQCHFALAEHELDCEHDEYAHHFALRESKLLPDNFDYDDADAGDYVLPRDVALPCDPSRPEMVADEDDTDYVFPIERRVLDAHDEKAERDLEKYDLFPTPPCDSALTAARARCETSREEALELLLQEMNTWRPSPRSSTATPETARGAHRRDSCIRRARSGSNRDKPLPSVPDVPVPRLPPASVPTTPPFPSSPSSAIFPSYTPTTSTSTSPQTPTFPPIQPLPYTYSLPASPVIRRQTSSKASAESKRERDHVLSTSVSYASLRDRTSEEHTLMTSASYASLRARSTMSSPPDAASAPPPPPALTSSASYASLRSRASRFPSISTTLSFSLGPDPALSVPATPVTPTTPTPTSAVDRTPPLTVSSSMSSMQSRAPGSAFPSQVHLTIVEQDDAEYVHVPPASAPALTTEGFLSVYPAGMEHCVSRWSVGTSVHGDDALAKASDAEKPGKADKVPKSPKSNKSIRKRVLSSLGFGRSGTPKKGSTSPGDVPPTPMLSMPTTPLLGRFSLTPEPDPFASLPGTPAPPMHSPRESTLRTLRPAFPIIEGPQSPVSESTFNADFALRALERVRADSVTSASYISASGYLASPDASYISNSGYMTDSAYGLASPSSPTSPGLGTLTEDEETVKKRKRMSWASRTSKGKGRRLIVSGLAANDARGQQAVKKWCEGFGEVSKIGRRPDGAMEVRWKSAEVADTVCRLQAQVNIQGAGSVVLSWREEKKRF